MRIPDPTSAPAGAPIRSLSPSFAVSSPLLSSSSYTPYTRYLYSY